MIYWQLQLKNCHSDEFWVLYVSSLCVTLADSLRIICFSFINQYSTFDISGYSLMQRWCLAWIYKLSYPFVGLECVVMLLHASSFDLYPMHCLPSLCLCRMKQEFIRTYFKRQLIEPDSTFQCTPLFALAQDMFPFSHAQLNLQEWHSQGIRLKLRNKLRKMQLWLLGLPWNRVRMISIVFLIFLLVTPMFSCMESSNFSE